MARAPWAADSGEEALLKKNRTILLEKIKESLAAVAPVTVVVLILCFTVAPVSNNLMMAFVLGALLLIIGMGFFTLGAEIAMSAIGEHIGSRMTKSRKLWLIISVSLFVGVMITISEPDLQVLANQVPTIPNMTLILSVALGVGVFLVVAMLRILFNIRLSLLLCIFYGVIFALAAFVPDGILPVAFDSGGVTTGPMTVPFIMALGVGVSASRSDKNASSDSFGLVALCSIGPILAVLILGLIYHPTGSNYAAMMQLDAGDTRELWLQFLNALPTYLWDVAIALVPIVAFFLLFQLFSGRVSRQRLYKILFGVLYTYVGLVLFLTGVNVGFMPAGNAIGKEIGALPYAWILIPVGMVIGYFIVAAEPAVHVLKRQVEELTSGAIPSRVLSVTLAIGVAVSVGLAMLRILTGIHILWLLLPGYAAALVLSFFVPEIFTSIAFDSGGVASGPMTATFLLPLATGACEALGGNVTTDAFGIVAMVAMTPLIAVQLLGLFYKLKTKHIEQSEPEALPPADDDIIEL